MGQLFITLNNSFLIKVCNSSLRKLFFIKKVILCKWLKAFKDFFYHKRRIFILCGSDCASKTSHANYRFKSFCKKSDLKETKRFKFQSNFIQFFSSSAHFHTLKSLVLNLEEKRKKLSISENIFVFLQPLFIITVKGKDLKPRGRGFESCRQIQDEM